MGTFSILTLIPTLMISPLSGIIGDRRNRRNIMIVMDIGRGLLICLLGILTSIGSLNIYIIFSSQIFISMMDSLFNSSSTALVPDLVSKDELIEANSIKAGFSSASMILGPALGGVIYGLWGIKAIFYVNGISFIISAVLSMLITYNVKIFEKEKINMKVFFKENFEVIKFIRNKKGLLQLFIFAMIFNFFFTPLFDIIIPYILKKEIGFTSQQYGYIMSVFTLGILFGNIAISVYFKRLGLKKLMKIGLIIENIIIVIHCILIIPMMVSIYGGATWILFISISICCIGIGFFNAFVNVPISTNFQNLVPTEIRSRFFSLFGMFSQGAMPLGCIFFGVLIDGMKYYKILIIINIISILAVTIFLMKACDEAYEAKEYFISD